MQLCVPLIVCAAAVMQGAGAAPAMKLDNVRLLVTNFDKAFVFYRDVIGLTPTWGKPGENYASFLFPGGAQVALFKRALMADAVGAAARPATRHEQDTAALVLSVDDVDAAYARLRAKGVEFAGRRQTRKPGASGSRISAIPTAPSSKCFRR